MHFTNHKLLIALAGLLLAAGTAQAADLAVTVAGSATGNVGLGKTVATKVKVSNIGLDAAAGVTVSLDVAAWPADQKITAIAGCTPPTAAPTTNAGFFPCAITGTIAPNVVGPPAVDNGKTVTVTVKYGTLPTLAQLFDANGAKIAAAWVCPAADRFLPVLASAATTTTDTDPANNSATLAAPQALWADVQATLTGPASISSEGGNYTFNYTVRNDGPCTVATDFAVNDAVPTTFTFVSATGAACEGLTDDFNANFTDYQYCDAGTLAPGAEVTGTKTYSAIVMPSDLVSTRTGTGLQITFGAGDYSDPVSSNDVTENGYVVTQSASGCSSTGAGAPTGLLMVGAALIFGLRRRRQS